MRTLLLAIALMLGLGLNAQNTPETTYKVNKHGELVPVVKKDTTTKVVKADPVYKVVGDRTFYKGPKGGIYEWKVNKKTGKKYKSYLQKEE